MQGRLEHGISFTPDAQELAFGILKKDERYEKMIVEYVEKYGQTTKQEIDDLILDILPSVLEKKKRNRSRLEILFMRCLKRTKPSKMLERIAFQDGC
ncbi:hypothetical protein [Sphingobacterium sp. UBA1498]|uniref:hypothetical protein n=1 Tax=Sphingobacterium sp. UBA1498 TaxID=1947481 RepID=UPI0025EEA862|nr:hypothetical protein [Sphingobacterium sp. UBA1498]